jgi:hypothetical protein
LHGPAISESAPERFAGMRSSGEGGRGDEISESDEATEQEIPVDGSRKRCSTDTQRFAGVTSQAKIIAQPRSNYTARKLSISRKKRSVALPFRMSWRHIA